MRQAHWFNSSSLAGLKVPLILAALAATLPALPAVAQTSEVGEVVVTARKREESVQDVPIAVTALSGDQLQERGIESIRDLGALAPNLYIQTNAGQALGGTVKLRGQQNAGDTLTFDPAVAVYIDKVYLPRENGLGAVMLDVESVQVLAGPQGTLFGKNSTGGALLITTRKPNMSEMGGFAQAKGGNHGQWGASGALSIPLVEDKAALRIAALVDANDGFGRDGNNRKTGKYYNLAYRAHLALQPTEALTIRLIGDYLDLKSDVAMLRANYVYPYSAANPPAATPVGFIAIAAQRRLPFTPAGFEAARNLFAAEVASSGFYDNPSRQPSYHNLSWRSFAGELNYEISDEITFSSVTGVRKLKQSQNQDSDGSSFDLVDNATLNIAYTKLTDEDFFSQEVQLLGDHGPLQWIAGGYYAKTDGTEVNVSGGFAVLNPAAPTLYDGDAKSKTVGIFGQSTYSVLDNLNITGGLRWTKETKTLISRNRTAVACSLPADVRAPGTACISNPITDKFSNWSYTASVDWHATEDVLLYGRTSRGFRGGGQNLRGLGVGTFEGFEPEIVTDYEVGLKIEALSGRARINLAAFTSTLKDAQRNVFIVIPATNTTVTVTTNAAKAKINGLELDALFRPVDPLSIRFTAGHLKPKYKQYRDALGDRTNEPWSLPKWTYAVDAAYELDVGENSLKASVNWTWQDDVQLWSPGVPPPRPTTLQRAYGLLGARLAYTFKDFNADIALWGRNLADKKYWVTAVSYQQAGNLGWDTVYAGRPREIGVEFTKRFGGER
jgi:iron complex outermembrane recepter protein